MILTCPQCETRFLVPVHSLGEDGRKVKCSNCEAVWHQLPDPEELEALHADEPEEIHHEEGEEGDAFPEGVMPDEGEEGEPDPSEDEDQSTVEPWNSKRSLVGYGAAAGVFLFVFVVLLSMQNSIVRAWPASSSFYRTFGADIDYMGQGLVFDKLEVTLAKDSNETEDVIEISGQIVNLTSREQVVPMVQATLRSEFGEVVQQWVIDLDRDVMPREDVLPFHTQYSAPAGKADDLQLRFVWHVEDADSMASDDHEEGHKEAEAEADHADEHHEESHEAEEHHEEPHHSTGHH